MQLARVASHVNMNDVAGRAAPDAGEEGCAAAPWARSKFRL